TWPTRRTSPACSTKLAPSPIWSRPPERRRPIIRSAKADMDFVRRFVDGKLVGAVMLAKHAVRTLEKGGSMTFTSGINKDRPPVPGGSVVSAIAGSFTYLARALALELAPTRVNIVSPGWVARPKRAI